MSFEEPDFERDFRRIERRIQSMSTTTQSDDPSVLNIQGARASFPALFEAKAFNDGKPAFSLTLLLDKKKHAATIKKIDAASTFVKQAQWKGKTPKLLSDAYRDGSEKSDVDGYGDEIVFISARSAKRVPVVDKDLTPLTAEDGKPYAGCYVNCVIRLWAQDNKFGKRVNASLRAVQFVKDGDPFGEKPTDANQVFSKIEDDEGVV